MSTLKESLKNLKINEAVGSEVFQLVDDLIDTWGDGKDLTFKQLQDCLEDMAKKSKKCKSYEEFRKLYFD